MIANASRKSMNTFHPHPYRSDERPQRHRILVCLDRSEFSEVCVPYAVSLAKTFGSHITLVHVMHSHQENKEPRTHDALSWEISRQEALAYLEKLGNAATDSLGRHVEVRLEQGNPADRIVHLAHEIDADILVLGSQGERGISSWTVGTTVQQLMAVARTSVLIVHSTSTLQTAVILKHILVPLDGSLRSESVLPYVTQIASFNGSEICLAHVVQEPLVTALLDATDDMQIARKLATRLESAAKLYLEHLQQRLAHEGTSVKTVVIRHTNERQGLLEVSRNEQSDLIVLSAHGAACDPHQSFGGVTTFLLTHSLVPLLVFQDLPEADLHRIRNSSADQAPRLRHSGIHAENA